MKLPVFFLLLVWSCSLSISAQSNSEKGSKLLWQIGVADDDNREFSLAPNRFSQYDRPGIHVVGLSDPAKSWPYIIPGELDKWAGAGPRTFEIIFFLDKVVGKGDCQLVMDFMDTHSYLPPNLQVELNKQVQEHQTQKGNNDWLMAAADSSGREYVGRLKFPASLLKEGENRIEITASSGSWALWDAIMLEVPKGIKAGAPVEQTTLRSVLQKQLLIQKGEALLKPITMELLHTGKPLSAVIKASGAEESQIELMPGVQLVELWIPETGQEEEVVIEIFSGKDLLMRSVKMLDPVRKWEVHLIHQTHLDIGFTHTQEEVLEKQTSYLNEALDLIESTKDYPEEARFRWHPEGMWAIDEFLRRAAPEKREQFITAVHEQSIHLDAFYVHLLSGLATGEELFELMQPAKDFERAHGVPVKTAIGSDIPGYSWGMVTAMAAQGVEFFNMAPNNNHRLGHLFHWADKPFYWLGPDGHSKVLTWMASHAYIYFWDQDEGILRVPRFLDYLEESDFPYDIAMLRYEIGGDNGHPDPGLPDKVKAWNEKYAYPKIILSTNSRLYDSFTSRYKDELPVHSGDLTPYWEDGATSTSADLAINRQAGERLIQARALHAMLKPGREDKQLIDAAWNNIIMYDEHTWGAYCSISDPFDPFTVSQERYKQRFALAADSLSREALRASLEDVVQAGSGKIDVFNTTSWKRSELVLLSPEQSVAGDRVLDDQGRLLVTQRLSSGALVFRAEEVPPFGSRRYQVVEGKAEKTSGVDISRHEISNDLLSISISQESGAIESIRMKGSGRELVEDSEYQLNEFIYMLGRDAGENMKGVNAPVSIRIEDEGPLLGTLHIESGAPGCNKLTRLVSLTRGELKIDIVNTIDKLQVLEPEGVYFAFPLNVPGGVSRVDIPWGVVRPEQDQLPGANRNFYSVQRWTDVSNAHFGVTWVTPDAPIVAFTPVKIAAKGRGDSQYMAEFGKAGIRDWWNESIRTNQSFLSWVMSNHWEVNYKAYQEGEVTCRYSLIPHEGGYHGIESEKWGREICQPLIATAVNEDLPGIVPPFSLSGKELLATSLRSLDQEGYFMLRLYNPGSETGETILRAPEGESLQISYCDSSGTPVGEAGSRIELPGYGVATILVEVSSDQDQ